MLPLNDDSKTFHVVCIARDYAIVCAFIQLDSQGHEREISYQSRQLTAGERKHTAHDKDLLAMKFDLVKFRVHILGVLRFVIYTYHALLRYAVKTPHLSQKLQDTFPSLL